MSTIPFFGIMALAMTLVVTLGEMDLSFPSVLALSALLFGKVFTLTGNIWLAAIGLRSGRSGSRCHKRPSYRTGRDSIIGGNHRHHVLFSRDGQRYRTGKGNCAGQGQRNLILLPGSWANR